MRVPLAAFVILASLAACAMPRTPSYARVQSEAMPLRAQFVPGLPGSGLGFHVNRPAHVAVFRIDPGFGVSMVYPRSSFDMVTRWAGYHDVFRWGSFADRDRDPQLQFASWARGGMGGGAMLQPRIFYMIASEQPLRVESYIHSSIGLRVDLGSDAFMLNPYNLANQIDRLVIPNHAMGDWVSDVYVEWPTPTYRELAPLYTYALSCRDGTQIVVPVGVLSCPQDRQVVLSPPADSLLNPGDAQPQRPDRRRPERGHGMDGDGPAAVPSDAVERPGRGARTGDRTRTGADRPEMVGPDRETARPRRAPDGADAQRPGRVREDRGSDARRRDAEPAAEPRASPPRAEPAPRPEPAPRAEPAPRVEPRSEPAPRMDPPRAEPRSEPPSP